MRAFGSNLELRSIFTEKDPTQGLSVVRTYEGTESAINGLITSLAADQTYRIDDSDAPLWRAIVRTPDDDTKQSSTEFVNTWELLGNDIQKDIYEHPNSIAISDDDLRTIREATENPGISPSLTGAAATLYALLLKGTTHYVVSQYVLRKTQTVSTRFQTLVAFSNIEKIHTTEQVITAEAIPNTLIFSISNIPIPSQQSGYQWGWLKKTPTVAQAPGSKFQITQEYWLEQWSTFIYGLAT